MNEIVEDLIFAYNHFKAIEELEESDFKDELLKSAHTKRKKALKAFMEFDKDGTWTGKK